MGRSPGGTAPAPLPVAGRSEGAGRAAKLEGRDQRRRGLTIGPNGTLSRSAPGFKTFPSPSGGTQYRIEARTMEEARHRVSDLKRKHPEIDVEATLAGAQMVETYPQGWVRHDLSIGGDLAGRSMVKSCLAWAFANGVEWGLC